MSPVHVLCSSGSKRNFLFLLDSSLVGYTSTFFEPAECGTNAQATGTCSVFDRWIGSRIAVGNADVRVPLFGPLGIVPKTQFVPPVEVAPFVDVGLAWNRYQPVAQRPVSSAGTSLRLIFRFSKLHKLA